MANNESGYEPGDYNKSGLLLFIASFGFSILFFFYLGYMDDGINLKEINKQQMLENEMRLAGKVIKKFKVTDVKEPWLVSEDMLAHGAKIYKQNCTTCHGEKGAGDGPSAAALKPAPRNLIQGQWKKGGTSIELFTTLTDGFAVGSSMASYKHLKVGDRWALVHFIRSITKDKPADDAEKLKAFASQQ